MLPLNCCSHLWHRGPLPLHQGQPVSAQMSGEVRGVLSAGDAWDTVALKLLIRPVFTPRGARAPAVAGSRDVRCPPPVTENKPRDEHRQPFRGRAAICGNVSSHFGCRRRVFSDSWHSDVTCRVECLLLWRYIRASSWKIPSKCHTVINHSPLCRTFSIYWKQTEFLIKRSCNLQVCPHLVQDFRRFQSDAFLAAITDW